MKQRIEIRDGQEFTVTVLPQDRRLAPSAGKKRAHWAALTAQEKKAHLRRVRAVAAKKRRKRRRRRRAFG